MPPTAKALRCESCGAALPEHKPTCDYCGSHHSLPAWPGDEEAPTAKRGEPRRVWIAAAAVAGILVLAVAVLLAFG